MFSDISMPHWSDLVLWYLAFLFAIVAHEAAHAWAAMKLGDKTAFMGGQVTLDPFPHLRREPMGTIIVPIFSYILGGWMIGWASTPYNRNWAVTYPKRAALMALAGPVANLLLVCLAGIIIRLGVWLGYYGIPSNITFASVVVSHQAGVLHGVAVFLSIIFSLNLILLVFNLLPVPPLDGSSIISLFLSDSATRRYQQTIANSHFALIGLILAWNFFGYLFRPIHSFFLGLLYFGVPPS